MFTEQKKDRVLLYTGQTVQSVSEDQFVFLVDCEFITPKISELLEIKKERKKKDGNVGVSVWGERFWFLYTHRFQ